MLSRLRAPLPRWRRALRRRRRVLVVLALAAAAAALLPAVLPPSGRGAEVVVTASPLPPGTVLAPEHLRTVRIAAELVPAGTALEVEAVLGRTTVLPLRSGAPLMPGVLADPGAPVIPEGSVLMAVPVPEVLVPHLHPGGGIALLSTDPAGLGGTGVPARVLEVAAADPSSAVLGGDAASTSRVLVTIDRARAAEVARALGGGAVVVTVVG